MQKDDRDAFTMTAFFNVNYMRQGHGQLMHRVGFDLGIQRAHDLQISYELSTNER